MTETVRQVGELLKLRNWKVLRERLADMSAMDIAELLLAQDRPDRVFMLKMLPQEKAARVVAHLDPPYQGLLIEDLAAWETSQLLERMAADDRTALLAEIAAQQARELIDQLPEPARGSARRLLAFPARSVGRLVSPDCIRLSPQWTVAHALREVRRQASAAVTTNVVFVASADGKLLGSLRLKSLILAAPDAVVASLLRGPAVRVRADADRSEAVRVARHYDLDALPVVDADERLIGVVTVDDLIDIAERMSTEAFHKLGGLGEVRLRLRDASVGLLYRKRIGWLLVLLVTGAVSSGLIAQFESTLQGAILLVTFLLLIVDSGGNAGAQSATLAVRALATGDVVARDWGRLLVREIGVATALGVTAGLAVWLLGFARAGPAVATAIALAAALVVVAGSMIGMVLPWLLERCRLDPAMASAPLVTSIADLCGIGIYLGMAMFLLDVPSGG